MRRDPRPPCQLMYETAAVLSNTCLPNSSGRNCCKARCTANSSSQVMCQSSQGPVQSPEATCPLDVAPQSVLEASVVTTTCQDTCPKSTRPVERPVLSFWGHKCTATVFSTWRMAAYPLQALSSRVVRMEEADKRLLAVKGAIQDFVSSSCTSGKKDTGAERSCEPRPALINQSYSHEGS